MTNYFPVVIEQEATAPSALGRDYRCVCSGRYTCQGKIGHSRGCDGSPSSLDAARQIHKAERGRPAFEGRPGPHRRES